MEIWLDTVDERTIKKAAELRLLAGVTTNPSILAKAKAVPEAIIPKILEWQSGPVCVQVKSSTRSEMISEAKHYVAKNSRIIVKVPVTEEGIYTIQALNDLKILTLATSVYDVQQCLLAAKANATYVAPYFGRIQSIGEDPILMLQRAQTIYGNYGFKTKIMVAALRDIDSILKCMEIGVHAVTIKGELFEKLIADNPHTEGVLQEFAKCYI